MCVCMCVSTDNQCQSHLGGFQGLCKESPELTWDGGGGGVSLGNYIIYFR